MQIQRNISKEKELLNIIRSSMEEKNKERLEGIHVSDLVQPLKAYWRKKYPLPLTEDEIGYFISGKAFEELFAYYGLNNGKEIQSELGTWNGINYEIDFFKEIPIELKSSRQRMKYPNKVLGVSAKIIDDLTEEEIKEEFNLYLQQLIKYAVVKNTLRAELYIFFLNLVIDPKKIWKGSAPPRFRCYDINYTQDDIRTEGRNMLMIRDALTSTLESKESNNPNILPYCPQWMCGNCKWFNCPCEGTLQKRKNESGAEELDF